jgi:hypothetical protein
LYAERAVGHLVALIVIGLRLQSLAFDMKKLIVNNPALIDFKQRQYVGENHP